MLPIEKMDFYMQSKLEDDMCEAIITYKSQPEHEAQNE